MQERTFDSVLEGIQKAISEKKVLTVEMWLDAGMFLAVFIESQEEPKLYELERQVAELQVALHEQHPDLTDKQIERQTKLSPLWTELQKQKGRIKMANEFIKIVKKHATLASELMRHNL